MRALKPRSRRDLEEVANVIREGGVIVYPTETVYGIGGSAFDEDVAKRVFELKKRERKPMPVLCHDIDVLEEVCYVTEDLLTLAELFWPGPLSVVTKKRRIPELITTGLDEVAVRIPANLIALELMRLSGSPLIGTSANISGEAPAKELRDLPSELLEGVDICVDGGRTPYGRPSTIVRIVEKGRVILVREGAIPYEEVRRRVKEAGLELELF